MEMRKQSQNLLQISQYFREYQSKIDEAGDILELALGKFEKLETAAFLSDEMKESRKLIRHAIDLLENL